MKKTVSSVAKKIGVALEGLRPCQVEEAFALARSQLVFEPVAVQPTRKAGELFTEQVNTLVRLGYSEAAGMTERAYRKLFDPLQRTMNLAQQIGAHGIPFLLVDNIIPVPKKMEMFHRGCLRGRTRLDPTYLIPNIAAPTDAAYLLRNISFFQRRWWNGDSRITREERAAGLNANEGVLLASLYPSLLEQRGGGLHFLGTGYREAGNGVGLELSVNGFPRLRSNFWNARDPHFPQCAERVSAVH